MVGKKSEKTLLREQGLERTDNNLPPHSWPQVTGINQKNYYTEYLKRDDQFLALRLTQEERRNRLAAQHRDKDRARAQGANDSMLDADATMDLDDEAAEDEAVAATGDQDFFPGTDVIVIHPGSQNLRIGFASDALPKTIPMVIARKWECNEWEEKPRVEIPKRIQAKDGSEVPPRQIFGDEFASHYDKLCQNLKVIMRQNKRKVLPNSKELVVNYNDRTAPEIIPEHNDPHRVEWTEIPSDPAKAPPFITGEAALRIPDESKQRYKLFWPIQRGWYNEHSYKNKQQDKQRLFEDITIIIDQAIKQQLGITKRSDLAHYNCIYVIPDLYDRAYVNQCMEMLMRELGFAKHIFIQESLAATIGSGNSGGCYVDIGAQKTSVCCVEDGQCIADSRVNVKIGGADVTELFIKMMLFDHFPYREIDLNRRYDFLLAEELKHKFVTMKEDEISVQLFNFHLRAPDQATKKYQFKTYDEVLLAPQGLFDPSMFDNSRKLRGRRELIEPSVNLYEDVRDDPISEAQSRIITSIAPDSTADSTSASIYKRLPPNHAFNQVQAASPSAAMRNSPTADVDGTPNPAGAPGETPTTDAVLAPCLRDDVLPVVGLDLAIITSILGAAKGDDKKVKEFLKSVTVVGGCIKLPGLDHALETALLKWRPTADVRIIPPSKEMDPQTVVWKGASVLAKVRSSTEYYVSQLEYERLGSRILYSKCTFSW